MRAPLSVLVLLHALVTLGQAPQRVQVFGTVTDSLSGRVAYTTVEHYDLAGKRWALTEVNGDGGYALFVPAGEPFELRVTPLPGQLELRRAVPAVPADARTFRLDLRLQPAPDADR
jgi:hypothetical protein